MKKLISIMALIFVIVAGGVAGCSSIIDINRLWKSNLYVQIGEPAQVEETRLDSGEVHKRYWYEQPAFDEDGEMSVTSFSAIRELREEGYLMLYVKKDGGVTSYDEVQWDEIPAKAQEQLNR